MRVDSHWQMLETNGGVGNHSSQVKHQEFAMPARPLVLAIVFFWVATTGWLFYRELWPHLRSGQPPPYTIDLADEARLSGAPISWSVFRGSKKIGDAQTFIDYRESDDTFELHSKATLNWGQIGPLFVKFKNLSSMYRVTRDGRLREIVADVEIQIGGFGLMGLLQTTTKAHVGGEVKDRRFIPYGWLVWDGNPIPLPLEPVEVPAQVSVLNPLHPIDRIKGLQKGWQWQMQLLNPLNDSLMALLNKDPGAELFLRSRTGVQTLRAEVLPDTQVLHWRNHDVPCLVIEYHSDDLTARTWVWQDNEDNGRVLRQEASFWGDNVVMVRDPTGQMR